MRYFEFIKDLFSAEEIQDIKIETVAMALNDSSVRMHWLREILKEIQTINRSIDAGLLQKKETDLKEKSARRIALQDVLEMVLTSKRAVEGQVRHNPSKTGGNLDLDKVRP